MANAFRKFSRILVILALLASVGGHWALLQSVAWTRMLLERTQTESLASAVQETFDGEHPCAMCKRITEGKQHERQEQKAPAKVKLDLVCERRIIAFEPPSQPVNFPLSPTDAMPRAERPPVPPPRLA